MSTMLEEMNRARKEGYALGAFNFFNYLSAQAVIEAAEECHKPVILQTSVKTVKYYGARELHAMVADLLKNSKVPAFLHLDHCKDVAFAKECVDAGWDSIMIDASAHPFEENIRMTKDASDYAHAHGVFSEGELGVITGVEEDVVADVEKLADYDDTVKFAAATGIDFMAPAIGTAHGVYKKTPHLNFELVERLGKDLPQPIVCHGGTGLSDDTFRKLISLGIAKVNISTALKHAYIDGAEKYARETPDDYEPLHLEQAMFDSVKAVAKHHIEVFANGR